MRHAIWVMLMVAGCAGAGKQHVNGGDELEACAREGKRGNFGKSIEHCTRAIGTGDLSNENLRTAYINLALSHQTLRQYDEAIRDCEKALEIEPGNLDAHFSCANAYGGKGDFATGVSHFEQMLKRQPNDAETHNNRGYLLNQAGDYQQAFEEFETALRLEPDLQLAQRNRGIALFNLGRFKEAAEAFALALKNDPKDHPALLWLVVARGRAGTEMAPNAVLSAAHAFDRNVWPWPLIAHFAGQPFDFASTDAKTSGETPETEALHKQDRTCEANFFYGEMAIIRGHADEAKWHLQRAAEVCPKIFIEYSSTMAELARM